LIEIANERSYRVPCNYILILTLGGEAMQKTSVILTGALFFGPLATSVAHPLDSPDIVYIDGQPCNSACQSYMAWSRKIMPAAGQPQRVSIGTAAGQAAARRVTGIHEAGSKPSAHGRVTKQAAPASIEIPQAKTTNLQLMGEATAAAGSVGAKIPDTRPAANAATASDAAGAKIKDSQPPSNAAAVADTPNAKVADLLPTVGVATDSRTRTTQQQVTAATAVAERMAAAAAVAIVIARPEIKSISDLAGKTIAIDDRQSAFSGNVRTAIAAAGAAGAQLAESQTRAIDRVIGGEVPAAVLTSVSREAADAFPEIAGFKIFRIPLTPEMPQAKVANLQSARAVAADTPPRTIQEQVAAATAIAERITAAKVDPRGSEQKTNSIDRFARSETVLPGGAEKAVPAPSSGTAPRIAIVMARPEIKSISDLAGKSIAIDDSQSASSADIRAAIAAAGATDVQVSEGQTQVINRLILAEVPAAVLTLVSPEAAEGFSEITAFRIFRIPLSPRSILVRAPLKTFEKDPAAENDAAESRSGRQ
jgi:ABC-type phosphate/phosphonate transport system substrate-binding protein